MKNFLSLSTNSMIQMNDFKREYLFLRKKIDKAVLDSLASGWYILGNQVKQFEANFAKYIGVKYCVGVANGMEALQIALLSLGLGEGDEILTVSNTAVATSLAITNIGAKPVFVDIDKYYHMNVNEIEKKITKKTKAILPVHLFGQVADMDEILKIAKKHNLKVVEDACQAHGGTYHNKKAGSFGDLGCFSFYPTKNLGGYGDSGAITTNSKDLYEKCLMFRNYGQKNRYVHLVKGLNSRMDELQAAILNIKLNHLERFVKKRNQIAQLYFFYLNDIKQVRLPQIRNGSQHSFHLFVIQAENRDGLRNYLMKNGVESQIHYPIPIHKQRCYQEYNSIRLFQTEKAAKEILSLPIHPFIKKSEVKLISSVLHKYYLTL